MSQQTLIDASMGRIKADVVITDVQPIDVISREILEGGIAIKEGTICRIGDVSDLIGSKTQVIKGRGRYASPAFIESHIHVESTMLTLTEFARAVIPYGTGTVIIIPMKWQMSQEFAV